MPELHHYRLDLPTAAFHDIEPRVVAPCGAAEPSAVVVEDLDVDAAYDDVAIIYRESEYRVDRYHYHHWSAPPGRLVGDALRQGLDATGLFARVGRNWDPHADAVLRGRVVALEEVDRTPSRWVGRVVLQLELVDAETERRLWARRFEEIRELPERSPHGLAAAVSEALADIVRASAAPIATTLAAAACREGDVRLPYRARADSVR
jgi:ABC-type uncharacterized transport system auxiliary subunit